MNKELFACIQRRLYFRQMTSFFAPKNQRNYVVPLILILNLAVFLMWTFADEEQYQSMMQNFAVSWEGVLAGRYWTLWTSVFSHNLFLHFLINMLVLRSFGSLIEDVLGSWRFLKFYMVAGGLSSLAHCLVSAFVVNEPAMPAVGASGALAGLVMVFSLLFPKERIYLFGVLPLPAMVGALGFIALDVWGLIAQAGGGGLPIGHGAHLGGAFTGIFYYLFFLRPKLKT